MNVSVGFIGLGVMGKPMALNLVRGGYPLRVYSRRAESMAPLVAAGAKACASPEEVARSADIILIMVSDTKDVEQVILGPQGVIAGARPGSTVADMSTISPEAACSLAARLTVREVEMLDAPVSGGEAEAVNGTLTLMVGGSRRHSPGSGRSSSVWDRGSFISETMVRDRRPRPVTRSWRA